jgi:hypothetical protein
MADPVQGHRFLGDHRTAGADGRGQTDVGGIYAWVMLEAYELTDEKRYLDEARAAIDAAIGLGFDINYQANLTAWGAAACMRLWRITNRDVYLDQSYVYLASFFHNCEIWESRARARETLPQFPGRHGAAGRALYGDLRMFRQLRRVRTLSRRQRPRSRAGGAHADFRILQICARSRLVLLSRRAARQGDRSTSSASNGHIDRKLHFRSRIFTPTASRRVR